jgi:universal stress protein E
MHQVDGSPTATIVEQRYAFSSLETPIMQSIRSILVVINPEHSESLALKRAKLIAGVTQAHLHLLVCDRKHDHAAMLSVLKAALLADGYSVTTEQAWNESLYETIIDVQQAEGCGLVIKQHFPDSSLKKALLTPADWKLLRHCPTPVLLVKTTGSWKDRVILAAVDVGNADGEHRHLHTTIIDHGYDIALLAKAHLHVISAHPSPMLSSADPTFQLKETIEARYREQCRAFQAEFDIDDEHLHIQEGPADVLIPYMANKLQAAVTVIGTVARSGLSGVLIGNTAEAVLDTLESDVLVLKPQEVEDHLVELAVKD